MSANNNSTTINLKVVERQVHRTIIEDGLLDITIGVYMILSSFHLENRSFIWNYLWMPIGLVLIEVIRRRFIFPRTGFVKITFTAGKVASMLGVTIGAMTLLTALLALIAAGIGQPVRENWREILTLSLIIFTVIFFCFIAFRFKVSRWYIHGLLLGASLLLGRAFDAPGILIALGIWLILVGGFVFIRIIQRFPLQSTEDTADAQ